MKLDIRIPLASLLFTGTVLTQPVAFAQVEENKSKVVVLTSEGTLGLIRPESFVIQTDGGKQEIEYSAKTTRYVDENDNPVPVSTVTSGLPVSVTYMHMGGRVVATKVVVRKVAPSVTSIQTGETSSIGVITDINPETFMLRADTSPDPFRYAVTKTTTYVDETGAPIAVEKIRSGSPVTVQYVKIGDKMVASKVVIRQATPATPDTLEKKTTTTTTTTPGK